MNIQYHLSFRKSQHGAATILMALIMLFSITIVSIFTARTTITEQKISGNEYRSRQAFEAAETGLQSGIAYFKNGGADHSSPPDGTDTFTATNIDGTVYNEPGQASYHIAFCDPDTATQTPPLCRNDLSTSISTCAAPPLDSIALVYACGWSDDRTAMRTISQIVRFKPALPNQPKSPFINRGDTNINGKFIVRNNHTNITVWTGSDIENFRSVREDTGRPLRWTRNENERRERDERDERNDRRRVTSGKFITEVRVDGISNTASTSTNDGKINRGPDVITNDANLANSSANMYFQNFFGKTKDNVRGNADLILTSEDGDTIPSTAYSLGKLIYATDDIDVNDELGSEDQPVILVVNGKLTLSNDSVIYGAVYAVDVETSNDATINGALMVENTIDIENDLTINFDPDVLEATSSIGATGTVSGSWHDW